MTKDNLQKIKEEFEKKSLELSYKHDNEITLTIDDLWEWIEHSINKALKEGYKKGVKAVKLPHYDHSKCPCPISCIGYQNAESDLEYIKDDLINKLKGR